MKYGKRTLWQRILRSPLTAIFLFVLMVILIRATWSIHQKSDLSLERLSQAELELARLNARKTDLAAKVDFLSTEQGIESEARTKYRVVKDGESVAVIIEDRDGPITVTTASSSATSTSWFGRLLEKIGL